MKNPATSRKRAKRSAGEKGQPGAQPAARQAGDAGGAPPPTIRGVIRQRLEAALVRLRYKERVKYTPDGAFSRIPKQAVCEFYLELLARSKTVAELDKVSIQGLFDHLRRAGYQGHEAITPQFQSALGHAIDEVGAQLGPAFGIAPRTGRMYIYQNILKNITNDARPTRLDDPCPPAWLAEPASGTVYPMTTPDSLAARDPAGRAGIPDLAGLSDGPRTGPRRYASMQTPSRKAPHGAEVHLRATVDGGRIRLPAGLVLRAGAEVEVVARAADVRNLHDDPSAPRPASSQLFRALAGSVRLGGDALADSEASE